MIFDLCCVVLVAISVMSAYKRGFFVSLLDVVLKVGLFAGVLVFGGTFDLFLKNNTSIYDSLRVQIAAFVKSSVQSGQSTWLNTFIDTFGLGALAAGQLGEAVADKVLFLLSLGILIVGGLLLIWLVLGICRAIADFAPVAFIDRVCSVVCGLLGGILLVGLVGVVVLFALQVSEPAGWVWQCVKDSFVLNVLNGLALFW